MLMTLSCVAVVGSGVSGFGPVCGSSTTRTRVAGAGIWVVLAGRGVLSWCWARHTDGCGPPRVATMSGPLYSCAELPLQVLGVLAAGCWTVGSWPTWVRADQFTSAHHAGRGARSWRDDIDIEEDLRVRRDLSHREGSGMRMTTSRRSRCLARVTEFEGRRVRGVYNRKCICTCA
jgi:hypothetical protein